MMVEHLRSELRLGYERLQEASGEQKTEAGFARFLRIALGSASELDYHLKAARDIQALPNGQYLSLSSQAVEVRMMLHGLLRRLEGATRRPEPTTPTVPSS